MPQGLRCVRCHYLTQVPSAGPALTCEDGWHLTFIRESMPEPESPSFLGRTSVRPAPDAPVGLSAQLSRPTAVTTADRKSSSGGFYCRFCIVKNCSVSPARQRRRASSRRPTSCGSRSPRPAPDSPLHAGANLYSRLNFWIVKADGSFLPVRQAADGEIFIHDLPKIMRIFAKTRRKSQL